ncbi:FadR/GntR family transcriptional regulator [Rhizobium terrae]|uniref:FadR/GntR family transcriptional regulator n=1 Tax=Rhizobium terrae TaxID=2171756 RepID=UPI000E3D8B60|nr:FadR/GntR family transcriptional regulator [Rhizobium terrae]
MFSVVEPRRLYRQAAEQMRALIERGEFAIGDRLPAERDLAEMLGVSRPTVREALIVLEVEGFVTIRMGSGVYVSRRNVQRISLPASENVEGPFELLRARSLVECAIVEEAARLARPDHIAALDKNLAAMATALDDRPEALSLDRAFHTTVAGIVANATLERFVGELHDLRLTPYFEKLAGYFENRHTWHSALEEHRAIRDAVAAGNPTGARNAMRVHLELAQRRLSESFGEEAEKLSFDERKPAVVP